MSGTHIDCSKQLTAAYVLTRFKPACRAIALLFVLISIRPALAEMVEVAPGVMVTRKVYSAPINEQPFYGFVEKSAAMRDADERFLTGIVLLAGSRQKAFKETTLRGWKALSSGNFPEAARRFNEAFLLLPEESEVYHGLAAVAQTRFNDVEFAEELFKIARKQPNPLKVVNGDYGRLLMIAKRPRDAQPLLEQAVIDTPEFGDAWSNLAFARLQNGDRAGACVAADEAAKQHPSNNASSDLAFLRSNAQCK
jgi:Tfp pilus assembly protein PilF